MVLFVLRKLTLQTRMRSHQVGLNGWTSNVRAAKALARLRGCAGSPAHSLVAQVLKTIISWAGLFDKRRFCQTTHGVRFSVCNSKQLISNYKWQACIIDIVQTDKINKNRNHHCSWWPFVSPYFARYTLQLELSYSWKVNNVCVFGFNVAFKKFSVISRRCLVATGSSVLIFIVLPHWSIMSQTLDMIPHPV